MSQCYAPNAVPVSELGPCNQTESISLCCVPGQICLTNGFCVTRLGQFYNGACTDKTYKAAVCPSFCMEGANRFVVECHNSTIPDGGFCCDATGEGSCCGSTANQLHMEPAISSAIAVPAETSSTAVQRSITMNEFSLESSYSQITSVETNTVTEGTSTRLVASTVTSTLVSASSTSSIPSHTTSSHPKAHFTKGDMITIEVCASIIGLLVTLVAVAIFWSRVIKPWRSRRQSRQRQRNRLAAIGRPVPNPEDPASFELDNMPAPAAELPASTSARDGAVPNVDGSSTPAQRSPTRREATDPFQTPSSSESAPRRSASPRTPPNTAASGYYPAEGSSVPPRLSRQSYEGRDGNVASSSFSENVLRYAAGAKYQ